MWHKVNRAKVWAASISASCLLFCGGATAKAQNRGPRDFLDDDVPPAYRAEQLDRAREITNLSEARARGEDVGRYKPPKRVVKPIAPEPVRDYADIHDSRYYYDAQQSPRADDQRPLRAPTSGHFDERIGAYDDAGSYARFPLGRSIRGGEDRDDAPGYLTHWGKDSGLANGYRTRGVQEFSDGYGQGVRSDDLYPLDPTVNPRAYRGHYDYQTYRNVNDEDDDRDTETLIRRELMVRPGANLRVSSTGTYNFRNYVDYGSQVRDRFRMPAHKRYQYFNP